MRLYHWTYGCRLDSIREQGLMADPPLLYTIDRDTWALAGLRDVIWFTCDPAYPNWVAGRRPDVRLTVEVPDDQRLVRFKQWCKEQQPEHWMIGNKEWTVAGCDDWFYFCGDIGPDAIIDQMSSTMDNAAQRQVPLRPESANHQHSDTPCHARNVA